MCLEQCLTHESAVEVLTLIIQEVEYDTCFVQQGKLELLISELCLGAAWRTVNF